MKDQNPASKRYFDVVEHWRSGSPERNGVWRTRAEAEARAHQVRAAGCPYVAVEETTPPAETT